MEHDLQDIKLELFERQNEIIQIQSDAITKLLSLLIRHSDVADSDFAPIKEKIDQVAEILSEHQI